MNIRITNKVVLSVLLLFMSIATCGHASITSKHVFTKEQRIESEVRKNVSSEHVEVVLAIIDTESKGDTLAVSNTGDYGIMQVNKATWRNKYDFSKMNELEYGIYAGCDVFNQCVDAANGNMTYALRLYNGSYEYANKVMRKVNAGL